MWSMTDMFSTDPAERRVEQAFLEKLVVIGVARAAGVIGLRTCDDLSETVMTVLESGMFDDEIRELIYGSESARQVASWPSP